MLLSPCPSGSRQREYLSTFINIPHCKQTQAEEHTQPGERSLSRVKALTSPGCISGESLAGEVTAEIQKFFSIFPEFFQHFFQIFSRFFFSEFFQIFFQNFPRIFSEFFQNFPRVFLKLPSDSWNMNPAVLSWPWHSQRTSKDVWS